VAKTESKKSTEPEWTYDFLAAYDVPPCKDKTKAEAEKEVLGAVIKLEGVVRDYFGGLFLRPESKYPIPVDFVGDQDKDGNPARTAVRDLATGTLAQRKKAAKQLALRLAMGTPGQAREGLLVVMVGSMGAERRVVFWRFTASPSIRLVPHKKTKADDEEDVELQIDPKAFTKGSHYFKAGMFQDTDAKTGFWRGHIKDNQVHASDADHARYWVKDFLEAQSGVTNTRGTVMLARAVKETLKEVKDPEIRDNVIQAAKLASTQKGMTTTLNKFAENLKPEVRETFLNHAGASEVRDAPFKIEKDVVNRRMGAKRMVLDGEVFVQAPVATFDERVKIGPEDSQGRSSITVFGKIVTRDLRPSA
jgi:hypothetical protein